MFPDLEFHHLQGLIAVARAKSFTKAAEELGVSQSALSRSIQKLELQIGQPLFDRKPRAITLTPVGEVFYERAISIISLVEDTFREVVEVADGGHVRLAAIPTIAPYFLPELLRDFSNKYPNIKVSVSEEPSEDVIRRCRYGEVDAAIIALPFPIENLQTHELFAEPLHLVLPAEHPLGAKQAIALDDIKEIPFVMLSREHCLSDQIESFCKMDSVEPISIERTSQLATLQELVSLEHGISIIPDMARNIDVSKKRIYRQFADPQPSRTIALVTNPERYQSQALSTFIDYLVTTHCQAR